VAGFTFWGNAPMTRATSVPGSWPISGYKLRVLLEISACIIALSVFALVASAQEIHYGVGKWDADSYGNHRAVVRVHSSNEAVWAHLPWCRRDQNPEKKEVLVVDAKTGNRVRNVVRVTVNREYGDFVFEPVSGPGEYYFYYLPYTGTIHSPYPRITYLTPEQTASPDWLARNNLLHLENASAERNKLQVAEVVEFQSVDEFNSFYPMEVIATREETAHLLDKYRKASYLVFPEDRRNAIRMTADLPRIWIQRGPGGPFLGQAARGENSRHENVRKDVQPGGLTHLPALALSRPLRAGPLNKRKWRLPVESRHLQSRRPRIPYDPTLTSSSLVATFTILN